MSGGETCEHARTEEGRKKLVVLVRNGNYSDFSGGRRGFHSSDWSQIRCTVDNAFWRTRAKYVNTLVDGTWDTTPEEALKMLEEREAKRVQASLAPRPPPRPVEEVLREARERLNRRPQPCPCDCHLKEDRMSTNPLYGRMKRLNCDRESDEGVCDACGRALVSSAAPVS